MCVVVKDCNLKHINFFTEDNAESTFRNFNTKSSFLKLLHSKRSTLSQFSVIKLPQALSIKLKTSTTSNRPRAL